MSQPWLPEGAYVCTITGCAVKTEWPWSQLCHTHRKRMDKYKTLDTVCRLCQNTFTWMGMGVHGKFTCIECSKNPGRAVSRTALLSSVSPITVGKHNLSHDDYNALFNWCEGKCQLCGYTETLQIDHDHKHCPPSKSRQWSCGRCIRGLLCRNCNLLVGCYEKSKGSLDIPLLEQYCNRSYFEPSEV